MSNLTNARTANSLGVVPAPVNGAAAGFLTTHQFALALGVRAETVRRWCRAGRLRAAGETPTGQYRFHPRQVDEALGLIPAPAEGNPPRADAASQVVAAQIRRDMLRHIRAGQNRAG